MFRAGTTGLVQGWYRAGAGLVQGWCRADSGLVQGWSRAGTGLVQGWYRAGAGLVQGSGLVLVQGWRLAEPLQGRSSSLWQLQGHTCVKESRCVSRNIEEPKGFQECYLLGPWGPWPAPGCASLSAGLEHAGKPEARRRGGHLPAARPAPFPHPVLGLGVRLSQLQESRRRSVLGRGSPEQGGSSGRPGSGGVGGQGTSGEHPMLSSSMRLLSAQCPLSMEGVGAGATVGCCVVISEPSPQPQFPWGSLPLPASDLDFWDPISLLRNRDSGWVFFGEGGGSGSSWGLF